jgi:hypothetical protein
MSATNYGFHYEINDNLQIEQVPHVWLMKAKEPRMSYLDLFPDFSYRWAVSCGGKVLHTH